MNDLNKISCIPIACERLFLLRSDALTEDDGIYLYLDSLVNASVYFGYLRTVSFLKGFSTRILEDISTHRVVPLFDLSLLLNNYTVPCSEL
jgi:hypothetical protein